MFGDLEHCVTVYRQNFKILIHIIKYFLLKYDCKEQKNI